MISIERLTEILSSIGIPKVNEDTYSIEFSDGDFRLRCAKNNERNHRFVTDFSKPLIDHGWSVYGTKITSIKQFGNCLNVSVANMLSIINHELNTLESRASYERKRDKICTADTAEKLALTDKRKDTLEKILTAFDITA